MALLAPPRDLLVAVDDSPHSAHAWAWAAASLLPLLPAGARCRLACVAVPNVGLDAALLDDDAPFVMPSDSQARREEARAASEAAMGTLRRLVAAHPPPAGVELTLLAPPLARGSVGETLAALAHDAPPDLFVLGSRGMGTFKRCAGGG
jgi:hypothetical protein